MLIRDKQLDGRPPQRVGIAFDSHAQNLRSFAPIDRQHAMWAEARQRLLKVEVISQGVR